MTAATAARYTKQEALQLDKKLHASFQAFAKGITNLVGLIREAQEKEIWKLIDDPNTNQPYKNWQGYIMAVVTREMKPTDRSLSPEERNQIIAVLLTAGVSQRGAADAVGAAPSVANAVAKGNKPGEPKPKPKPNTSQPQRRTLSARVGEFLDEVSRRMDEIATSDLDILDKRFTALHRQCAATLKKRSDATKQSPAAKAAPRKAPAAKATHERQAAKRRHPSAAKKPAA